MYYSKENFLNEIESISSRLMSCRIATEYLYIKSYQDKIISMIRRSLRSRRDCYPYVHVSRQIYKKICKNRKMIIL